LKVSVLIHDVFFILMQCFLIIQNRRAMFCVENCILQMDLIVMFKTKNIFFTSLLNICWYFVPRHVVFLRLESLWRSGYVVWHVLPKYCVWTSAPPDIELPWTSHWWFRSPSTSYWLRVTYTCPCGSQCVRGAQVIERQNFASGWPSV
jgi:hypothetical protein